MTRTQQRRFSVPTTYRRRQQRIARSIATWRPPLPRCKMIGRTQSVQAEIVLSD
jgi:hypothetical protein